MAARKSGLGRGLDALIPVDRIESGFSTVPLDRVDAFEMDEDLHRRREAVEASQQRGIEVAEAQFVLRLGRAFADDEFAGSIAGHHLCDHDAVLRNLAGLGAPFDGQRERFAGARFTVFKDGDLHFDGDALAAEVVALAQIDIPDLPDAVTVTGSDTAVLRAVASLYFAMEIEGTGLTRALSMLAWLYASGGLNLGRGDVATILMEHHRSYEARRPSDDRFAAYLRLFGNAPEGAVPFAAGDAVNATFEAEMLDLAEAMHRYANVSALELAPTVALREIRSAARTLVTGLLMRGGGASHYLAEEALELVQRATTVFGDPIVQTALAARGFWSAVDATLRLAQGRARHGPRAPALTGLARSHLIRGRSGLMLLNWLAENAQRMAGMGTLDIPRDAAILAEGTSWLQASFDLLSAQEMAYDAA